MYNLGAIILARQIMESDIWSYRPAWWLKVWIYILIKVNHKDNKLFKRGENLFTYEDIFFHCGLKVEHINKGSIDNVMRYFKKQEMCTTRKTTRGLIINVCNYDTYQNMNRYSNCKSNEKLTKPKRNCNDTITEECKNDKNKKKYKDSVFLTKEEHEKLVHRYGDTQTRQLIDKLDLHKGANGKTYKSDYKAILNWVVKAIGAKAITSESYYNSKKKENKLTYHPDIKNLMDGIVKEI